MRISQNAYNYNLGNNIMRKFLQTVEQFGYKAGIYTNIGTSSRFFNLDQFKYSYSIWCAHWQSTASLESFNAELWQTGWWTNLPGVTGDVDTDIIFIDKPGKSTNLNYITDKTDSSKVTLKWDYINKINDYQIEITQGGRTTTKDVSIGGLILAANTMTAKVDLSEGTNKFRVRAINKKYGFEEIGEWSDYVTIKYEGTMKGDTTGDKKINIRDIIKIRKYIANSRKWDLTTNEKAAADVTGDGKITLRDIIKIRKYIAASSSDSVKRKHPDWIW